MKKELEITQSLVNYYKEKAKMLSMPFYEQYKILCVLGNYITEDIASDWMNGDLYGLDQLCKKTCASKNIVTLYSEINNNFNAVSYVKGADSYDDSIWTLEGLEHHSFWEKQRELAKQLLIELEKIEI